MKIHLIYIPFERNGIIKTDTNIVGAPYEYYQSLKNTYKTYDVILWSYASLLQIFPEEMAYMLHHMDHAVQLIDYFRWKVVERYGGLYIQIGTKIRFKDLNKLMPRQPYGIRLFTEFVLPTFMCNQAKQYLIRDGKAEDSVRVMTQVFATHQANHPFVTQCCEKIYQNIVCCATTVTCDYDILYLTGNCCITEEYHKAWKLIPASMELTGWIGSLLLIHLQGQGSWRRDKELSRG
jgi:mannosyltransferase OCH1-like enzyme